MSSTNISKSTPMTIMSKQSDDRERIEDTLLRSYISEKEILITYYKDDYFPTSYMIVTEIHPLQRSVVCIDTFGRKHTFSLIDIIDAR
ncbi:YolD-like family protein [Bacillus cereus]|jgi:hypothetical protein|uniref:YolD-like family protein n=1 Tax=Bacillus cereus TaxID=1396 RepID=UPI0018791C74|nr:YolD-like family protein [Bacillus cereus]MBE7105872.1 YolD-like family protein [Bacillus cereus]